MICERCGKELPDKATFCPFCGTATPSAEASPATSYGAFPADEYENPYEPDIHGTFVSNEQKSSYLWTLFFSFVTSIRDFCGIVRMGAEGFGSNNLRRIIFTTKSGSPYVPQVPF